MFLNDFKMILNDLKRLGHFGGHPGGHERVTFGSPWVTQLGVIRGHPGGHQKVMRGSLLGHLGGHLGSSRGTHHYIYFKVVCLLSMS